MSVGTAFNAATDGGRAVELSEEEQVTKSRANKGETGEGGVRTDCGYLMRIHDASMPAPHDQHRPTDQRPACDSPPL
eukprot:8328169-Pyramimonas_sp.AAC.1